MIIQKLFLKGISKEVAKEAFNGTDVNETEAVRDLIIKKSGSIDKYNELPFEEKSGFIRKLMEKGFSYDCVRSAGEISCLFMIDIIPERQ